MSTQALLLKLHQEEFTPMSGMTKEEREAMEAAIIKGIDAWMDKKFVALGQSVFRAAIVSAFGWLFYLAVKAGFFTKG